MSEQQKIWNWIRNFLINQNIFTDESLILLAYPTGTALPRQTNFVIITRLEQETKGLPITTLQITNPAVKMQNYLIENLQTTRYQIDFYGAEAYENSEQVFAYIHSPLGSNDLISENMAVESVELPLQLTAPIDRDVYTNRYVIRFKIQYVNSINVATQTIDASDINVTYMPFN